MTDPSTTPARPSAPHPPHLPEPDADRGPDGDGSPPDGPPRPWRPALSRGLRRRCPNCGHKTLFDGYLKIRDHCPQCGLATGRYRTDDAPAYLTLLLSAHIVAPLALTVDQWSPYSMGSMLLVWVPVLVALCLWMLPRIKGGVLAIQWANRIEG